MENAVLSDAHDPTRSAGSPASRALEARRAAYADEVRRLVEASFSVIRESGSLEPTVGAIVRVAGLSNKAFYRHFRSKDELLLTVLDDGIRQLAVYLRRRMDAADTPVARVRTWISGVLEQALNPRAAAATRPFALSRARLADLFPDEVARSERQLVAMLAEAIAEGIAEGTLEGVGDAAEREAGVVYGLAMGWLERQLAPASTATREDAEHLIGFCLRGLGGA